MQVDARRRGHAVADGNIIDAITERPDVAALVVQHAQALHEQVRDSGFTVGSRHSRDFDPRGWRFEPAIGDCADVHRKVRNGNHGDARRWRDTGAGVPGRSHALAGNEQIALLKAPAVRRDAGNHDWWRLGQPIE